MAPLSNGMFNENQPLMEKLTHGYHPMTEGVRWTEKYAHRIENIFSKMPKFVTSILATIAIFVLGTSLQGNLFICTLLLELKIQLYQQQIITDIFLLTKYRTTNAIKCS